jgi:glycosyltransferase involved in cell wall biosynthesis
MPRQKLTIVQLVPSLDSGGVERGALEVSEALTRRGHRSIIISSGGRLVDKLTAAGGEHICWEIGKKTPLTLKWVWPLRQLLRHQQVDILHARSRVPAWVGWLAWRSLRQSTRPRFVTTAHGLYSVNAYSAIMASGERVISVSEAVDGYLRQNYPRLNPARLRLIPRGIDPEEFPRGYQPSRDWLDQWYQSYPQLLGRPVMSLVGRITRLKGHHDFLKIVDLVRQRQPDVCALIVGEEDPRRKAYAAEIREQVKQLGLQEHVIFTGHRPDVREIYAVSNVSLSLTAHPPEAFGRSVLEALNIGTPVVGWETGGTVELLKCIYPPGLIPAGNIELAAERVLEVFRNGAVMPSEHPYLKHHMLRQTLDLYEELAAA